MFSKPTASDFLAGALLLAFLFLPILLTAKKRPPLHPININTANSAELQQVPGIGPATAEKILKMRKAHGPFKSVEELRAIKGIGPKRLAKMRLYLTVGDSPPKKQSRNARGVHFQNIWCVGLGSSTWSGT
jgi:competence ComEA-like helix-hairpin-helix protein